jgi:thioredoxin reductase (NADPH)
VLGGDAAPPRSVAAPEPVCQDVKAGETALEDALDCLIIGGGPAGLTAAIYLARFRRNIRVIDADDSRAALIPVSHNHAGFPEGVHGTTLLRRMRDQAQRYYAPITRGTVSHLERADGFGFLAKTSTETIRTKTVLIATGVKDGSPDEAGLDEAVQRGLIRYCGICDGYEAIGKKIGVIGRAGSGIGEAVFLQTYTSDVTLFCWQDQPRFTAAERREAEAHNVSFAHADVGKIDVDGERLRLAAATGQHLGTFDAVYLALGSKARTAFLSKLDVQMDVNGCVVTNEHQGSSVEGLYAAGDVVRSLDQISVAMGEAAIAATAIHNQLRRDAWPKACQEG